MKKCLCILTAVTAVLALSGVATAVSINGEFPSGEVGVAYPSPTLYLSDYASSTRLGGYSEPMYYDWNVTRGKLPDGLEMKFVGGISWSPENYLKMRLEGTPTRAGLFEFTLRVNQKDDASDYAEKAFSIVITEDPNMDLPSPVIQGTFPSSGAVGTAYSGTIEVTSGTAPYEWEYDESLLPDGLTMKVLSATKRELSGVPTKNGTYRFTVKVTDTYGKSDSQAFSVVIGAGSPTTDTPTTDTPTTDTPTTDTPTNETNGEGDSGDDGTDEEQEDNGRGFAIDGELPSEGVVMRLYRGEVTAHKYNTSWYVIDGKLPTGLEDAHSGIQGRASFLLHGLPKEAGTFTFTLQAKHVAYGGVVESADKTFTITIAEQSGGNTEPEEKNGEGDSGSGGGGGGGCNAGFCVLLLAGLAVLKRSK